MNYKVNVTFSKLGEMRFISHLDLMRIFQRALRRAALPITITQGFNPHPKISIKRAIKLGIESENEEAAFSLFEAMGPEEFKRRLNEQLPEGIGIVDAKTDIN